MLRISVGQAFTKFDLIDGWEFDSQGVTIEGDSYEPYEIYTTDSPVTGAQIAAIQVTEGVRLVQVEA